MLMFSQPLKARVACMGVLPKGMETSLTREALLSWDRQDRPVLVRHGSGGKGRTGEKMLRVRLGSTVLPHPDSPQLGHMLIWNHMPGLSQVQANQETL